MSYPILYSATETSFDHNGIGILSACVSCEVTEEANGIFELAMQYPMDGIHYEDIADRAIIKAKADQFRDPQLFRVYAISKPMNGIVTVLAEHISYDLSGIPVKPFSAESVSLALAGLRSNAVVDCPFDFWTDKATSGNFNVPTPASIRSRLGGVAGSILDVYGGEYEFDNYTVKLHNNRGMNRGVSIRYGKNLTDIQQEQNCSSVATGVYPYWAGDVDGNTVLVELPEKIVNAPGTYNFVKIRTFDLTSEFETQPTVEQLRTRTESYIKANNIGVPKVSLTVSFAQLEQSEEYKHLKLLERVSLFDTVNVEFSALGVSATAKAVKMVYDVLADRVKSVTLGSVRANIADTIANQQQDISKVSKDKLSVSLVQNISSSLAKAIMGANGGAVRLVDTNDDGEPDELYIADNADPAQALKVWRFNYNGWAASKNGYSGPFEFGATLEDGLLANFVTAAQLVAGTIKSQDDGKTFFLDLDNGILKMAATELSISGKTVDEIANSAAEAAETAAKNAANAALNEYAATVAKDFEELQAQIDGNITSWFGDVVPTASNEPAVNWDTEELKNQHLGDLYYINEGAEQGGTAYRWALVNGVYKWVIVEDTDVAKALAAAAQAQDTADSKRRVFVAQPTPPYDVGDLWAQGNTGDLMRCKTSRASGNYSASDWELASKYIDENTAQEKADTALKDAKTYADGAAKAAVDAQTFMDIFNKWTNNGQEQGIYAENGVFVINAAVAKFVNLITDTLRSVGKTIDGGEIRLNIQSSHLDMQSEFGPTAILTTLKDIAYFICRSYDKNGDFEASGTFSAKDLQLGTKSGHPAFSVYVNHRDDGTLQSTMDVDRINVGKTLLWSGTCAVGRAITVPFTGDYDLFAIKLGDNSEIYNTTVLGYKSGNVIHGVGGFASDDEYYKRLFYVTINLSGNTWTVTGACRHSITAEGSVGAEETLSIKEIRGVI